MKTETLAHRTLAMFRYSLPFNPKLSRSVLPHILKWQTQHLELKTNKRQTWKASPDRLTWDPISRELISTICSRAHLTTEHPISRSRESGFKKVISIFICSYLTIYKQALRQKLSGTDDRTYILLRSWKIFVLNPKALECLTLWYWALAGKFWI